MVEIVPAREEHVVQLAAEIREADRREVWALAHRTPEEAALETFHRSEVCEAALFDGVMAAMWGIVPGSLMLGIGVPWLLTGKTIEKHPKTFVKAARIFLDRHQKTYPVLTTIMHNDYTQALRWARCVGFTLSEPIPFGPDNELFVVIERKRNGN